MIKQAVILCGGLGKRLMLSAINMIKQSGLKRIVLEVDNQNERAIQLYEELGFKIFPIEKDEETNSLFYYYIIN